MDPEFWHERWSRDEIGFHEHEYNTHMMEFMHSLGLPAGGHVLVPLCGKSLDLLWIHERGYHVTGIELSRKAIEDFFAENGLTFSLSEKEGMAAYRHETLELLCGNFFSTDFSRLKPMDGIYDRAALVALPPDMRSAYAGALIKLLRPGKAMLLVTLDYPQQEMNGPPFSVPPRQVEGLYHAKCTIEQLHAEDCLAKEPRLQKKGLTRLHERVYRITRKET